MKRKTHSSPEAIYQAERDRVRRQRDAAFAQIMEEARREFQLEVEASRIRGKGGRPRKDRANAGGAPVAQDEHALDHQLDDAAFEETVEKEVPAAGARTADEEHDEHDEEKRAEPARPRAPRRSPARTATAERARGKARAKARTKARSKSRSGRSD